MTLYRINDWASLYETAETRKLESLRWVPVVNRHDGLGFRRMAAHRDKCELLAAWTLLIQVASRGKRGERGLLARDGQPMTPDDLSVMTGFPAHIFSKALEFFSSPKQGWLVAIDIADDPSTPASCEQSHGSPGAPAASPARPASPPVCPPKSPAEWNGMEGNGMEKGGESPASVEPVEEVPMPNVLLTGAFKAKWAEYVSYRRERGLSSLKPVSVVKQWEMLAEFGHSNAIESINQTIRNGWQGLFEPKKGTNANNRTGSSRSFSQQSSFAGITDK